MTRNHSAPVQAARVHDLFEQEARAAGTFSIGAAAIVYVCPCGCGQLVRLPLNGSEPTSWGWDGDMDRPTLSPSIRRMDGCRWHGHLVGGVWQPCDDSGL